MIMDCRQNDFASNNVKKHYVDNKLNCNIRKNATIKIKIYINLNKT